MIKFINGLYNYNFLFIGQQDFDSRRQYLSFYRSVNCRQCHIRISNDDINEASEQVFVIQLTLVYSRNSNLITLSRNVSLGIIIDDDRKLITVSRSL